ncbi:hypothetical protein [uncultured Brachyspira sp.]|uniref:hypothetical protein n=1 Tax=uncultured Brachyspira sp. TaxID=221953 RepID=UPI002591BC0F|nr:hypothetical protein [uncultured Brachyspira sp.]
MSKKLLTIFSLLLIFFVMSCNNKSTDSKGPDYTDPIDPPASRPLKDSQYVGKWYEEISNDPVIEIKQDGSIDLLDKTEVLVSASGTDVIKEGDAVFKTTFSKNGKTAEIVLTFTNSTTGSMLLDKDNTITIVKK